MSESDAEPRGESESEQLSPWQKNEGKFRGKQVFLIGFGFFASSAAWSVFNSNVSVAFETLLNPIIPLITVTVVGILMTLDNFIGVVLQPITGSWSDRMGSKYGRRMPFILIGLPISAIAFLCIPLVETNFVALLVIVLIFNTSMGFWRAPVVSLMPDFVAPKDRSKGNGIINFLGGLGAIFAFGVGGLIIKKNVFLGFFVVSIVMVVALIILFFGVKEPDTRGWDFTYEKTKEKVSLINSIKEVLAEKDKSALLMLLAIFFWFLSYQGLESLWTIYAGDFFGLDRGSATFSLTFVALPFMLFAIPAGIIAKKFTRKKTIMVGLIIGAIAFLVLEFIKGDMIPVYILFPIFGVAWALININSIAMIWQMAPTAKHIGTYTGLYYFFSFLAAIVGPIVLGFFMDFVVGRQNMFIVCVIFFVLAILCVWKVKRGEVTLSEEEKAAKEKAIQEVDRD